MQEKEIVKEEKNNKEKGFSVIDFFRVCAQYWYWFLISMVVCTGIAYLYAKSQPLRYTSYARILIKSDQNSAGIINNSLFNDMGMNKSSQSLENEMFIIKAMPLIELVVNRLNLNIAYYEKTGLRKVNIYKNSPIDVKFFNIIPKSGISMEMELLNANEYRFKSSIKDGNEWRRAKFGARVVSPEGIFVVTKTPNFGVNPDLKTVYVNINDPKIEASMVWDNLTVKKAKAETTVVELSYKGDNFQMNCDILDNLIDVYNQDVINDKNRVAKNTEAFIFDRISAIGKDLGGIDFHIEQLKISNNIPDVTTATGTYVGSAEKYYDDIASIGTQLTLVRYIRDYLNDNKNRNGLIPANTGIADLGIENLITSYNEECIKLNKLVAGAGVDNPWAKEQAKTLQTMHSNILHSVDNLCNTLQIKLQQLKMQENIAKARISTVPTQEKEINDVLRQQKIKEELYLYLLNKREENALKLAITEPNVKVVDKAGGDEILISPNTPDILMSGFFIGLLIPALILYLIYWIKSLDTKIHTKDDLEESSNFICLGEIPHKVKDKDDSEIVVEENGNDSVSEALRIIRSNFEYVIDKNSSEAVVAQLTSTIPGEGKSFVSINMALSFAQAGKKVLLIDLDLRKGNLSKILDLNHHHGLSSYLSDKITNVQDVIHKGIISPNLDVIPIGTIPPNPSGLIMKKEFGNLIDTLKKEYDYIFLDTVPYNIVVDAALINKKVDMTVYVIRAGKIDKRYLPALEKLQKENKIKNLCLLLTDVYLKNRPYGVGGAYGYGYG